FEDHAVTTLMSGIRYSPDYSASSYTTLLDATQLEGQTEQAWCLTLTTNAVIELLSGAISEPACGDPVAAVREAAPVIRGKLGRWWRECPGTKGRRNPRIEGFPQNLPN
ncbi:hypothetical protein, partial [Nocardia sp. NPDC004711]